MAAYLAAAHRIAALSLCCVFVITAGSANAGAPDAASLIDRSLLLDYLVDESTFFLVDARSPDEFAAAHISGAVNVPHDAEQASFSALPEDRAAPIIVYCQTGKRARLLRNRLLDTGYTNVRVLQPEQIVWFDGLAVFNCAVDSSDASAGLIDQIRNKEEQE